jgi:hypothetical protein
MSTRANIIIKDKYSTLFFYRHSDGYPECTGEDLKEFVKGYDRKTGPGHMRSNVSQSAGWLIVRGYEEYLQFKGEPGMGWKVGAYEPTEGLHWDVEYIYIINLEEQKLECLVPDWDLSDDNYKPSLLNTHPCEEFETVKF